jgi:hypothetical protein
MVVHEVFDDERRTLPIQIESSREWSAAVNTKAGAHMPAHQTNCFSSNLCSVCSL